MTSPHLQPPEIAGACYIFHMKRICRYDLESKGTRLELPLGAQVLSIQIQRGQLQLWALVDIEQDTTEFRRFRGYRTGQGLPEDPGTYICTVQSPDGTLLLHFFEV